MKRRDFILFLIASAIMGISQSIDSSMFNNFVNDTFHLSTTQRTILEIPREFPGMMVVFVSGILIFIGDVRIAAVANIMEAVGMAGIAFLSTSYSSMIVWIITYSMGLHLFMPMSNSIGMNLSDKSNMGKRLGQINSANTAMFLVTSLSTAVILKFVKVDYRVAYSIGAFTFLLSAILILMMKPHKPEKKNTKRFILRKEYKLFYLLSVLFGARKQIFITFAPWVLIRAFKQDAKTFAFLGFTVAALGVFFKPFVGHLIDKLGEKFVLSGEAFCLIIICLGYAYSQKLFDNLGLGSSAVYLICACYVIDQMLLAAGMARATYLRKIALKQEDISPTLSTGVSMDHIASMFIPWFGGIVWERFGYEYVFLGGACIAVINLIFTSRVTLMKAGQDAVIKDGI